MSTGRIWLAAVALGTSACLWERAVHEIRPAPSTAVRGGPSPGPQVPLQEGEVAPAGAPAPAAAAEATPSLPRPRYTVPPVEVVALHGMLVLAVSDIPPADAAVLRLSLPAGEAGGLPGLARLAAEVAAELRLPTLAGGSLREALALRGASLRVTVDAATTVFEVVFPRERAREVLDVLGERLARPADPQEAGAAIAELRFALARRLVAEQIAAPLEALLSIARGAPQADAAQLVRELGLRTPVEVAVFQRARHRADGAVLALWVPGVPVAEQMLALRDGLLSWLDPDVTGFRPQALAAAAAAAGLLWAERDELPQLALRLELPDAAHPLAAELMVLRECFSHDGVGGRLDQGLRALGGRPFAFTPLPAGEAPALRGAADAELIGPLLETARRALAGLGQEPPGRAEVEAAAGRARLRLLHEFSEPATFLRRLTDLAHRQGNLDGLNATLARLESSDRLRIAEALPVFTALPLSLAVVGSLPASGLPEGARRVTEATLPEDAARLLPPAEAAERESAAAGIVERAVAAVGGSAALRALAGYRTTFTSAAGEGPDCASEVDFLWPATLRVTRRILATTIATEIAGDQGSEKAGDRQTPLALDEVRLRQRAAERHPLVLLSMACRGELRFRLVGQRKVDDRELAVLEPVEDRADDLRLSIDTGSGLVRLIESREWLPDGTQRDLREELWDYRPVRGGLRAPFLRIEHATGEEGKVRSTTQSFEPR